MHRDVIMSMTAVAIKGLLKVTEDSDIACITWYKSQGDIHIPHQLAFSPFSCIYLPAPKTNNHEVRFCRSCSDRPGCDCHCRPPLQALPCSCPASFICRNSSRPCRGHSCRSNDCEPKCCSRFKRLPVSCVKKSSTTLF